MPARVAPRHHPQAVVGCLLFSFGRMAHVAILALLLILIFAVLGMQLFLGKLNYCSCSVRARGEPPRATVHRARPR